MLQSHLFVLSVSSDQDRVQNASRTIRSWTALHSFVESSFDNDMIPLAVPFLRKSASFTLLMNASCNIFPSASGRTNDCSGQSVKCSINRHGSCSSESSEGERSEMSMPVACDGEAPENRS